jgi:hypothetical protein
MCNVPVPDALHEFSGQMEWGVVVIVEQAWKYIMHYKNNAYTHKTREQGGEEFFITMEHGGVYDSRLC